MKRLLILAMLAAALAAFTGCTSMRTPSSGAHANKVFYNTVFGISIDSAVSGDGIMPK